MLCNYKFHDITGCSSRKPTKNLQGRRTQEGKFEKTHSSEFQLRVTQNSSTHKSEVKEIGSTHNTKWGQEATRRKNLRTLLVGAARLQLEIEEEALRVTATEEREADGSTVATCDDDAIIDTTWDAMAVALELKVSWLWRWNLLEKPSAIWYLSRLWIGMQAHARLPTCTWWWWFSACLKIFVSSKCDYIAHS